MMRRGIRLFSGGRLAIGTRGGLQVSAPAAEAPAAESSALVSGASAASVNVLHTPRGTFNGKPYYVADGEVDNGTNRSAISWDGASWQMFDAFGVMLYESFDDVAFPWQATWSITLDSINPPPTVTEAP